MSFSFKRLRSSYASNSSNLSDEDVVDSFVAQGKFGLRMLQILCDRYKSDNILFSPVCLQSPFTLLYACSSGVTGFELRLIFDLLKVQVAELMENHNLLMAEVEDPDLHLHSIVAIDSKVPLKDEFSRMHYGYTNLDVYSVDFANRNRAYRSADDLMNTKTTTGSFQQRRVDFFSQERPPLLPGSMFILNSTHFLVKFECSLQEAGKFVGKFTVNEEEAFEVEMIKCTKVLRFQNSTTLQANILELPLVNVNNFMMYIILPFTTDSLLHTEAALYDFDLTAELRRFSSSLIDITIPKFRITNQIDMKEPLQVQGIRTLFDRTRCNLAEITESPTVIDAIYHRASIEFTATNQPEEFNPTDRVSQQKARSYKNRRYQQMLQTRETFTADRPFLFIVRKNDTSGPVKNVLIGRYMRNTD